MHISLVCTVRNEADNIAALLDSMLAQGRAPTEIVVNDCGSSDNTAAIVAAYALRDERIRLVSGGTNIPSGRNNAIRHASYSIVACTDAGLTLDPQWLGSIVAPIEAGEADLVGGFHRPAPQSTFELALAATNYRHPEEVNPAAFLPFGQSIAFRKEVWAAVGGFPEWANHCEDIVFDQAVARAGYRPAFVPAALVYFRPRPSLRAFFHQYYTYAIGDGRADLWRKRYVIRYGVYVAALLLLAILFSAQRRKDAKHKTDAVSLGILGVMIVGASGYTRSPYRRLWPQVQELPLGQRTYALALVPLIRIVGDVAKMLGYPVGIVRRLRL